MLLDTSRGLVLLVSLVQFCTCPCRPCFAVFSNHLLPPLFYLQILPQYPAFRGGSGQLTLYSDSLPAGRFGDRIPVGARFSAPVQTGPGTHPASCTMGRCKAAGAWCWPPTPSSTDVEERVELFLYYPSGPSWPVLGRPLPLPLPLTCFHKFS